MKIDRLETSMASWTNHFEFMYLKNRLLDVRLRFVSNSLKGNDVEKQVNYMIYGYKQVTKFLWC